MYKGESNCRFLGGRLSYLKRHVCKNSHTNDQWRRVTKCVFEPRVTGRGLFKGLRKMNLAIRAKVSSRRNTKQAKSLLNTKNTRSNRYVDRSGKKGHIVVRFNSPANLAGLGIKAGASNSNTNPNYLHITIHYANNKKVDLIRRPKWSSKRVAEKRLWTGHLSQVKKIEYFFTNSKSKSVHMTELTFYGEQGARLPRESMKQLIKMNEGTVFRTKLLGQKSNTVYQVI